MNKQEVVLKVAEKSGVSIEICEEVLDAFEDVLSDEFSNSNGTGKMFDRVYGIMKYFKGKKSGD